MATNNNFQGCGIEESDDATQCMSCGREKAFERNIAFLRVHTSFIPVCETCLIDLVADIRKFTGV